VTTSVESNGTSTPFRIDPAENRRGAPYGDDNATSRRCHPGVSETAPSTLAPSMNTSPVAPGAST
jgi:hypothetical protein